MPTQIPSRQWFILRDLAKNLLMFLIPNTIHRIRGSTGTGNRQLDRDIPALVVYAQKVFQNYCRYLTQAGASIDFKDKTILELGPGDTMATAFIFIAHGARRVMCFDRFNLISNVKKNSLAAKTILSGLPQNQRVELLSELTFDGRGRLGVHGDRLCCIFNKSEKINLPDCSVDIIVSNAVLEHVRNLDKLFADMYRILKPGGMMVHAVDLKSHDPHAINPLDFLTLPDGLWKWLTCYRGAPNRKRKSYYDMLLKRCGFQLKTCKITNIFCDDDCQDFIRKNPGRGKAYTIEDLSCGGFIFAAQKP